MAFMRPCMCSKCNQSFTGVCASGGPLPTECNKCAFERENKKRTEYFDKLDKLSIEERIRKIEEFIYVNSNKINRLSAELRY